MISEGKAWQLPLVKRRMLAQANSIMGMCDATETDDALDGPGLPLSPLLCSEGSAASTSKSAVPLLPVASFVLLPLASLSWTKRMSLARNVRLSDEGVQPYRACSDIQSVSLSSQVPFSKFGLPGTLGFSCAKKDSCSL